MAKRRDPLNLSSNWHFDCRIESELPEDRAVGTRFLVSALFGSVALILVILAGWLAYRSTGLRSEIRFWQQQIENDRADVQDIKRTQQQYTAQVTKIEQAIALVRSPFLVSGLVSGLGRTKPGALLLDSIDWNENGVIVRGSGPSAGQVNSYVDALKADPELTSMFSEVRVSNYEQMRNQQGRFAFEITMTLALAK